MFTGLSKYQIIYFMKIAFFVIYHLLGHTNTVKQKKIFKSLSKHKEKENSPIKYKYTILF